MSFANQAFFQISLRIWWRFVVLLLLLKYVTDFPSGNRGWSVSSLNLNILYNQLNNQRDSWFPFHKNTSPIHYSYSFLSFCSFFFFFHLKVKHFSIYWPQSNLFGAFPAWFSKADFFYETGFQGTSVWVLSFQWTFATIKRRSKDLVKTS